METHPEGHDDEGPHLGGMLVGITKLSCMGNTSCRACSNPAVIP